MWLINTLFQPLDNPVAQAERLYLQRSQTAPGFLLR